MIAPVCGPAAHWRLHIQILVLACCCCPLLAVVCQSDGAHSKTVAESSSSSSPSETQYSGERRSTVVFNIAWPDGGQIDRDTAYVPTEPYLTTIQINPDNHSIALSETSTAPEVQEPAGLERDEPPSYEEVVLNPPTYEEATARNQISIC